MKKQNQVKTLCDLFRAYYDARKNKRNSFSVLSFERSYESRIFELHDDIIKGRYRISPSICFISFKPLQREIFAANFRDRVVHHFIYNYINPIFERIFINDSYSCRKGKGTSYGIKRLNHFIRSCSDNYKKDCFVLKIDIKGYFMSIDRPLLYKKIDNILNRLGDDQGFDVVLILRLIRQVIFHDSTKRCLLKGKKDDWIGLPKTKSLFFAGKNKGLPIGNITSQLFGNVYLNDFDHFAKHVIGCKYYGRYVDDIVIVHQDKEHLKSIIPVMRDYFKNNLFLDLHPKKIQLQHFSKGAYFLGFFIKPYRVYMGKRIKSSFYFKINYWNKIIENLNVDKVKLEKLTFSLNSYLGIIKKHNTFRFRKKMLTQGVSSGFFNYVCFSENYNKILIRKN